MPHPLTGPLPLIALVLICGLALTRGGAPERAGALLVAFDWGLLAAWRGLAGGPAPEMAMLASDLVLASGFLVLALRFASLWLGVAMLLQAGALALHLVRISEAATEATGPYVLEAQATGYAVLALLGVAAVAAWRRRGRTSGDRREPGPSGPLV